MRIDVPSFLFMWNYIRSIYQEDLKGGSLGRVTTIMYCKLCVQVQ